MKIKVLLLPVIILSGVFFMINGKRTNYSEFIKTEYNKLKSFDKPDISGFRDFLMTQDPELQRIPLERLPLAFEAKTLSSQLKSTNSLNWLQTETTMGGRTRDLMYDPTDATHKKVWACSVTGGLWYNTDVTSSTTEWQPVSDNWTSMATTNICYDPNATSTFYVGTGEPETAIHIYRESSGRGFGIWKTTDAGQTWSVLPSTEDFAYISDIEVRDENGTSVIYCAVMSGEYKGGTFQAIPSDGLYRSDDDGVTWTQVLPNIEGETVPYAPSDIEIADNGTIYIGTTNNLNGDGGSCILKSTTGLSGSWSVNTDYRTAILADTDYNIPGRVELSASKSNPTVVYAIIGAGSNTELIEGFGTAIGKYIVKTTNSGTSWNSINMPADENGKNWAYLSWHAFTVQVSPDDEDVVYIGGLDINKTINGGTSWTKVSDWVLMYSGGGPEFVHGDIHKITYNPASSNEFVVATDGGNFYTSSANSTPVFVPINDGYNTFQFYSCGVSYQAGDNRYTGGLQDNGTFYYSGHPYELGDMLQGGDGAFTMWDKNDDNLITSTYDNSMIMYYDGGYTQINDYTCGTFISPYDYDSDDKVIYSNAITFTGDYPDQIFRVTGLPTTHIDEFVDVNTGTQTPFSAVRFTKTDANVHTLIVGNYTGELFKINNINATPSTSQIDNGQLPNAYVSCIQTSKNADTILVTLSNYGVQSVWQTYNGGAAWTDISGNLPDMPIRWAIYHPQNKKQVMLATETGIWVTDNAQEANVVWTAEAGAFPNVRVDMLSIRPADNFLVAGTHGRGMYTTTWDFVSGVKDIKSVSKNNDLVVYPNPANYFINLKLNNSDIVDVKIYSPNGALINEYSKDNRLNISDYKQGQYILKVVDNNDIVYSATFIKK